jgi:hypothetical protein
MNTPGNPVSPGTPALPNGSGAAALLAAGIGSFALGVLAFSADQSALLKRIFDFYAPTGPLSGVTTVAILIWLLTWAILEWHWRNRTVAVGRIAAAAIALLGLSLVLTFPTVVDLF